MCIRDSRSVRPTLTDRQISPFLLAVILPRNRWKVLWLVPILITVSYTHLLKALGIQNIQILSGDKQSIVSNFAEKLGISEAYGDPVSYTHL